MESIYSNLIEIIIPDQKEVLEWLNTQRFAQVDGSLNALQTYFDQGNLSEKAWASAFKLFSADEFNLIKSLEGWIGQFPQSYAAQLANGIYLVNEGHRQRGYASAQDVTKVQWGQMHACFAQSYRYLVGSLSLYHKPILSYVYLRDSLNLF